MVIYIVNCVTRQVSRLTSGSVVRGVYPVMRKCRLGVGMRGAMSPMRSLFM